MGIFLLKIAIIKLNNLSLTISFDLILKRQIIILLGVFIHIVQLFGLWAISYFFLNGDNIYEFSIILL